MARVALDAGVIIGLYNDQDAHHKWAVDFMFQTVADELHISALNYAEICVYPTKNGVSEKFLLGIQGLDLHIAETSVYDVASLTDYRIRTTLRMTDVCAIQLASKLDGVLATTDKAVAKAAKSLGLEVFQP